MNICFTINQDFIPQLEVTLSSILSNADKEDRFDFYVITDYISEQAKTSLSKKYINLHFITAELNKDLELPLISNLSSIVYLRLQIPTLLQNLDKVLFLDCDLIVNSSLKSLYDTDLSDSLVGAIEDYGIPKFAPKHIEKLKLQTYFNAGVLLMNLRKFREELTEEKCYEVLKNRKQEILFQDQDILNIVCQEKTLFLDKQYNYQSSPSYKNTNQNGLITHYVGKYKPWNKLNYSTSYTNYWIHVFKTRHVAHFFKTFWSANTKLLQKFFKYALRRV